MSYKLFETDAIKDRLIIKSNVGKTKRNVQNKIQICEKIIYRL
jgi:hypothetical protein